MPPEVLLLVTAIVAAGLKLSGEMCYCYSKVTLSIWS